MSKPALLLPLAALLLVACRRPDPAPTRPLKAPAPLPAAYASKDPGPEARLPRLEDPVLKDLVEKTLRDNLDLQAAWARLEQAEALLASSRAALRPTLGLSGSATRERASLEDPHRGPAAPGQARDGNRYEGSLAVSWEIDLFGRLRKAREGARSRFAAEGEALEALRLSLAAEVATVYASARTHQEQLRLDQDKARLDGELELLARALSTGGQGTDLDVLRVQAARRESLASAEAQAQGLALDLSRLAVLTALGPAELRTRFGSGTLPRADFDGERVGVPSDLLQRRPDIREAFHRLQAASQEAASTAAARFPRLNLGASLGVAAASTATLGTGGALLASIGPALSVDLLDGGRKHAERTAAEAKVREAQARYWKTVQAAFAETETLLQNLESARLQVAHLAAAAEAQRQARDLARLRFRAGVTDMTSALELDQSLNRMESALVQARRDHFTQGINLAKALGGGDRQSLFPGR